MSDVLGEAAFEYRICLMHSRSIIFGPGGLHGNERNISPKGEG